MKATGDQYDRIQSLADRLEDGIRALERDQFDREADFQKLYADSAELLGLSRKGPAYIRERARRLNDLLDRTHRETGYDDRRFQLLFRQLDKIKDPVLSDYFSPSLQRRLDRIGPAGTAPVPARPVAPVLYRLGEFWFLLERTVIQHRTGVHPDRSSGWKFPAGPVEFFPLPGEAMLEPLPGGDREMNLMLTPATGRQGFLGLWYHETTAISGEDARRLRHNQEPLRTAHRCLTGRVRFKGTTVYILRKD